MNRLIKKAINPIRFFITDSRSTGVLLLVCTAFSLILTNTIYGDGYRSLWNGDVYGPSYLPHSGLSWINNFLMAFFFLFAGMEIKRELMNGELSSFKRAILPFGAALGGMVVPALIFILFNINSAFVHGWGIPTATDIAFSIGIASLFGKRIPPGLIIFLMALAIIDDLGAIIVIALFYGGSIKWLYLLGAAFVYGLLWACNYKKIKPGLIQLCLSVVLWYMMFNSGIEASISGVLVAFSMPVNSLAKLENALHKTVNFIILPLFALANTAILIPGDVVGSLQSSIGMGVMVGLVMGKPAGIFLFSSIMVKLKIANLPGHTNLKQLLGMGSLAGIGFTMSIFTTALAFTNEQPKDVAKIAILASLVLSTAISGVYFAIINKKVTKKTFGLGNETAISPGISLG